MLDRHSAAYNQQRAIADAIIADVGRRLNSAEMRESILKILRLRSEQSSVDRELLNSLRLTIALLPYAGDELELVERYMIAQRRDVEQELYEDEAVGDVLYDNQIHLVPAALDLPMGLNTTTEHR